MVVNLYTTRIILQNLGANDYGIYNVVYGFVTMFTVFNMTLTAGINRYYNYEMGRLGHEGVRGVYNAAIRIQALFAAIVFVIVEVLGIWYVNDYMVMESGRLQTANWVFQFAVISMMFIIMQNPFSSAVIAFEKMDFYAIISITDVFLKLGIAFVLAYSVVDGLLLFGGLMSLISVMNFFAYYLYCKHYFSDCICLTNSYDKRTFKDMLKFSGWMSLDPIAYSINGQGVNILLNSFFGTCVNAAFGIANQIGQAIDTFCMNLSTAFRPQMVQSYSSGNRSRSINLFIGMSKIGFALFLLICIPIVLNIRFIYDMWLGDTYPPIALSITVIFVFVKLIGCINHPVSYIVMAKGALRRYMTVTCAITSSILPIAYILLELRLSVEAVFVAMLVIAIINQIASIDILSREIAEISRRMYYAKVFLPCLLLLITVFASVLFFHSIIVGDFMRLVIDFLVSSVTTTAILYYAGLNGSEKALCLSLLNRVLRKH